MATSRPTGCCRQCLDERQLSFGTGVASLCLFIGVRLNLADQKIRQANEPRCSQPSWRRHPETDIVAYAALEILEDTDERKDRRRCRRAPVEYVSSSRRPGRTARPQGY